MLFLLSLLILKKLLNIKSKYPIIQQKHPQNDPKSLKTFSRWHRFMGFYSNGGTFELKLHIF